MKTTHVLLCLLLLAADIALPLAGATHTTDVLDIPLGPPPQVPEDAPVDTPVLVADEALQDLWDSVGPPANETLVAAYERYNQFREDREELASTGMIRPYSDGMGTDVRDGGDPLDPDIRMGGFGEWRVFGDKAWGIRQDAARTGEAGFTSATKPDGTYGANVRSLLLSPELDLRTGLGVAPARAAPYVFTEAYSSNPPQDELYEFSFYARYNLGFGQDGVNILVFTNPPDDVNAAWNQQNDIFGTRTYGGVPNGAPIVPLPGSRGSNPTCSGGATSPYPSEPTFNNRAPYLFSDDDGNQPGACWHFVEPVSRSYGNMNGGRDPAFTGHSPGGGWTRYVIDLSKWSEQRIWIGFSFRTDGTPPGYFEGSLFNPDLGFYGFQLDDARLDMATVPYGLRLRTPQLPSATYPNPETTHLDPNFLTVPADEAFPFTVDVVNMGFNRAEVEARIKVYMGQGTNGTLIHTAPVMDMDLGPGGVDRFEYMLPALANTAVDGSKYTVEVEVENVEQGYRTFPIDPDLNSTDEKALMQFNVITFEDVHAGVITESSTFAGFGEPITLELPVRNDGNRNVTVEAEACGIDLGDESPSCDLRIFSHLVEGTRQSVDLGPGVEHTFRWTAKDSVPSQHQVFVRAGTELDKVWGFSPDDFRSDLYEPLRSRYVDSIELDGDREDAWDLAPARSHGTTGSVRILNNDTHVFFAVDGASGFRLLLDDLADHVLPDGAGGSVRIWNDGMWDDLRFDSSSLTWGLSDGGPVSAVARNGTQYEIAIPIGKSEPNGPGFSGLAAGPGDFFGLMLDQGAGPYPLGSSSSDSNGNNVLTDELLTWQPIRLGKPDDVASDSLTRRFQFRGLSAGLGIERSPPAVLKEDFQQCPDVNQWVQENVINNVDDIEQWNCGEYGPDRRVVLYEGLSPDSVCVIECTPHSRLGSQQYTDPLQWSGTADSGIIYTPPFKINSKQPYLFLQHQYSTESWIMDSAGFVGDPSNSNNYMYLASDFIRNPPPPRVEPVMRVFSAGRVYLEVWDEQANNWQPRVLLRPEGGYTTDEDINIIDPREDQRRYVSTTDGWTHRELTDDREGLGFWWPTGFQPLYREAKEIPLADDIASGAMFQGSPWSYDRFPLFGSALPFQGPISLQHYQNVPSIIPPVALDTLGKTVRVVFDFQRSNLQPGDGERDYGWRIGGIAVADGERFQRDLSIEGVRIGDLLYDPLEIGVGPGTTLPAVVTLSNQGHADLPGIHLRVQGRDARDPDADPLCVWDQEYAVSIAPGESREFDVACEVPSNADGSLFFLQADAEPGTGDDFRPNNRRNTRDVFEVRTTKDVAVQLTADPGVASSEVRRSLAVVVENRGNVRVSDFDVELQLSQVVGVGTSEALGLPKTWHVISELPVNTRLRLDDERLETESAVERADLFFKPPFQGVFEAIARVSVADDADPANDVDSATMQARSLLYQETLDWTPFADAGTVTGDRRSNGTDGVWSVQTGSHDGGRRLLAGDPLTGDIPTDADASIILPDLDLTTVKGATLTFKHRYALEKGFDGARLEVSADGKTWRPLPPRPQPLEDLPEGHPSIAMLGINPLLDGEAEATAVAFTGDSAELGASEKDTFGRPTGWITSEFDLSDHPDLQRWTAVDAFSLNRFTSKPQRLPEFSATGERQFRDASWALDEPGAEGNQRYWWIQDVTSDIEPHSGNKAWWSGTAGTESEGFQKINTTLDYRFDVPVRDEGERTFLRWWEYRAGSGDAPAAVGTGGIAGAYLYFPDADSDGVPDVVEAHLGLDAAKDDSDDDSWGDGMEVAGGSDPLDPNSVPIDILRCGFQSPNGAPDVWERRYGFSTSAYTCDAGFDLDQDNLLFLEEAKRNTSYLLKDSDGDGFWDGEEVSFSTDPLQPDLGLVMPNVVDVEGQWVQRELEVTSYAGIEDMTLRFFYYSDGSYRLANNLGYMVDDLALVSYRVDPATGIRTDPHVHFVEDMEVPASSDWTVGSQGSSGIKWHRTEGVTARGPAWTVEQGNLPGRGPTLMWRFGDDSDQGYPHGVDARLVTPLVDLASVVGDEARLTFDHQYGFESLLRSCRPACTERSFRSALDAGVVEVQVFNETDGTFGPWQQIGSRFRDFSEVRFEYNQTVHGGYPSSVWTNVNLRPNGLAREADLTGYSAIDEKGWTISNVFESGSGCSAFGLREPLTPNGVGSTFERHPGLAQWLIHPCENPSAISGVIERKIPWREYGYTPVFSGDSNGWQNVDWDISPLLGKQVRFAFHVASNPSLTQNYTLSSGVQEPWAGWSIANVAVEGGLFQGKPVQLRLRVATDGSLTKGEWSVDNIELVGDQYRNNVAVVADSPKEVEVDRDETVIFDGRVVNIGTYPRGGLALSVQAFDANKNPFNEVTVHFDGEAPDEVPEALLPAGTQQAFGAFSLKPGGLDGSSLPFHVEVKLPDRDDQITVRVQVLQANGEAVIVDGVSEVSYGLPDNEVSGNTFDTWVATGRTVTVLQAVPTQSGTSLGLVPDVPRVGVPIQLSSEVENNGTTEPFVVARWSVFEVQRKGDPSTQPSLKPEKHDLVLNTPDPLGVLLRGKTAETNTTFTLKHPGLYRAVVEYVAENKVQERAQMEFLLEKTANYYQVDFTKTNNTAGWTDNSPPTDARHGGSPPPIRFRHDGSSLIWGVDAGQIAANQNYCSWGGCMTGPCPGSSCTTVQNPKIGLEGVFDGPPIDLTQVPEDRAILVLQHSMLFTPDDGARFEFVPYSPVPASDGTPQAAVMCKGRPASYIPQPVDPDAFNYFAQAKPSFTANGAPPANPIPPQIQFPARYNPLAIDANEQLIPAVRSMMGGARTDETLLFDLSVPAMAADQTCMPQTLNLINYTVAPHLRTGGILGVGVPPNYMGSSEPHPGSQGWQIRGIAVSSIGLEVTPEKRSFPVLDGAPKFFGFNIHNIGQVPESFLVRLDQNQSTLPPGSDWIHLSTKEVRLAAGEVRTVPFQVDIPPDPGLSRGVYIAQLEVQSASAPSIRDTIDVALDLQGNPLPDLSASLSTDEGGQRAPAGSITPIYVTVRNLGQAETDPVRVQLVATDEDGVETPIGTLDLDALCPQAQCGGGSRRTLSTDWVVPDLVGTYTISALADVDGRLLEERLDNNAASMQLEVVPLEVPDLAITALEVEGLAVDGFAEEGDLVVYHATVTNLGLAEARNVQVQVLADSALLAEESIPVLGPGQSRDVSAFKVAFRGESIALAYVAPVDGESNTENNQFKQAVRVRGHDLVASLVPEQPLLEPGSEATVLLNVGNGGNTVERLTMSLENAPGWNLSITPDPLFVPPGKNGSASLRVLVPEDAVAGIPDVRIVVAPATNAGAAVAIERPFAVAVAGGPPLLESPGASTVPGALDVPVNLTSVTNTPQNVTLRLASPDWPHEPVRLSLQPYQRVPLNVSVAVPAGTIPGNHTLQVEAVLVNGTVLSQVAVPVEVLEQRRVEAAWSEVRAARPVDVGNQSHEVLLHAANTGNVPVELTLVPTDLAQNLSASVVVGGVLEPGATQVLVLRVDSLTDVPAPLFGTVQVWMRAAGAEDRGDLVETLALPDPTDAADLHVVRMETTPRTVREGETVRVSTVVENRGVLLGNTSRLYIYLDGALLEDLEVPAVPPGEQTVVNATWTVQRGGTFHIVALADAEGGVGESEEANNGLSTTLDVEDAPVSGFLGRKAPAPPVVPLLLACALLAWLRRREAS